MQKLLGFFLLLSILALGGTNWVKIAQADSPTSIPWKEILSQVTAQSGWPKREVYALVRE